MISAIRVPTWRIVKPVSSRSSVRCLLASSACTRLSADFLPIRSRPASVGASSRYRSARLVHQLLVDELVDQLLAQAVDVHRVAMGVPAEPFLELVGAAGRGVGAVDSRPRRPIRSTGAPQLGQVLGNWNARLGPLARVGLDPDDLRDDLAGLLDDDRVADPDVLALELVGVVQAGTLDGRAGQLHRLEVGDRA